MLQIHRRSSWVDYLPFIEHQFILIRDRYNFSRYQYEWLVYFSDYLIIAIIFIYAFSKTPICRREINIIIYEKNLIQRL